MSSALPNLLEGVDIDEDVLPATLWETIYAFCERPAESEDQTARLERMIHNMNWIASVISKQPDFVEKTLRSRVSEPPVEATDEPVCRTATGKRKAIDTADPISREKKKTRATSALERPEPTSRIQNTATTSNNSTIDRSPQHNVYIATTPPSTEITLHNKTRSNNTISVRLSPSGKGVNWLDIWVNIVSALHINKITGDNPRWVPLLTKVLTHTFGYDGVNDVLQMTKQVYDNLDLLKLDATNTLDGPVDSPLRPAAVRMKKIWATSKGDALMAAETMVYYKELAADFLRLETDTFSSETSIGQLWLEHSKGRTESLQVRQNFVLDKLLEYINPSIVNQAKKKTPEKLKVRQKQRKTAEDRKVRKKKKDPPTEKEQQKARLQKERIMARNIALMVKIFGHGILPLMAGSTWRETQVWSIVLF